MALYVEIPNKPHEIVSWSDTQRRILHGAAGGFLAGVVFLTFQMLVSWILLDSFFLPLRMAGAILLGDYVVQAWYSSTAAGITGLAVHSVLSVAFGAAFAFIAAHLPFLEVPAGRLIAAGMIYGFVLWVVNYCIVAEIAGLTWFLAAHPLFQGLIGHTLFFGAVLGIYMSRKVRVKS